MRPLDEIIVKDLDVPCGFWSFAVRAYPFQIPETIAVGNRRMQRARANVWKFRKKVSCGSVKSLGAVMCGPPIERWSL
jgi:hypothetical protein